MLHGLEIVTVLELQITINLNSNKKNYEHDFFHDKGHDLNYFENMEDGCRLTARANGISSSVISKFSATQKYEVC